MLNAWLKWRWIAAAVAPGVLILTLAGARTARAAPGEPVLVRTWTERMVDRATERCLDSNASGNVYTLPCNGGNYQNWIVRVWEEMTTGGGTTHFKSFQDAQTERCLDSNSSGNIYTLPCQAPGNPYQDWLGEFNFKLVWGPQTDRATGRCLDSNSNGDAYTLPCNGGDYQYWNKKRQEEEAAAKKRQEEGAAKKRQEEEAAAKRRQEEEATAKKRQEVPLPAPGPRHVRVKVSVKWSWTGASTRMDSITVGRLPPATRFGVVYRPTRGHGRRDSRDAYTERQLRALIRWLERRRYRAGDRLSVDISRHGYVPERATFTIRNGREPKLMTRG